ncbi:MAG: hypothetical protein OXT67_08155 [Zetaproteobacteria bacterium]|nr:hypothetical protein [Zetaproteobacteria bacterium]
MLYNCTRHIMKAVIVSLSFAMFSHTCMAALWSPSQILKYTAGAALLHFVSQSEAKQFPLGNTSTVEIKDNRVYIDNVPVAAIELDRFDLSGTTKFLTAGKAATFDREDDHGMECVFNLGDAVLKRLLDFQEGDGDFNEELIEEYIRRKEGQVKPLGSMGVSHALPWLDKLAGMNVQGFKGAPAAAVIETVKQELDKCRVGDSADFNAYMRSAFTSVYRVIAFTLAGVGMGVATFFGFFFGWFIYIPAF